MYFGNWRASLNADFPMGKLSAHIAVCTCCLYAVYRFCSVCQRRI